MQNTVKLHPIAYLLIAAVLGIQVYTSFLRGRDVDQVIEESDRAYKAAVFDDPDTNGVMHQVFRQNEIDRELLKVLLQRCAR